MSPYVPLPLISTRTNKNTLQFIFWENSSWHSENFYEFLEATSKLQKFPHQFPSIQKADEGLPMAHGNLRLDPWPCWQWDQWIHGYGHLNIHHCQRTGQDQGWGGWVEIRSRSKMLQDAFFFDDSEKIITNTGCIFFWLAYIMERLFWRCPFDWAWACVDRKRVGNYDHSSIQLSYLWGPPAHAA